MNSITTVFISSVSMTSVFACTIGVRIADGYLADTKYLTVNGVYLTDVN